MQIAVQTMSGYDHTLELARWCEQAGVSALAVADHYLSGPSLDSAGFDQLVILGGIARETSSIELCTLVSPLTFRHPAVHLKAAVTLDQMSDGRFTLGIGTGWMTEEHDAFGLELFDMGERFDRLEETLAYIRAALDPDSPGFQGEHYRLQPFTPQPLPSNLRIVVGGGGPTKTPTLAGRYADEFNVFPHRSGWAERIGVAHRAAESMGRDPAAILLSTAFPSLLGEDEAEYRELLEEAAEARGRTTEDLESALTDLGVPFGTVEQATERLAPVIDAGIERTYLQLGRDTLDGAMRQVELFGQVAGHS